MEAVKDPPKAGETQDNGAGASNTTQQQLTLKIGGKNPTTASTRLVGGKIDLDEQFLKGDKAVLRVEVQVVEVAFKDQEDAKTGTIIGSERRHKLKITGITRVD